MKKYQVKFYYYTDLRCDWVGEAFDDRMALTLALAHFRLNEWAVSDGFHVTIHKI
jgi:hypothetical protein